MKTIALSLLPVWPMLTLFLCLSPDARAAPQKKDTGKAKPEAAEKVKNQDKDGEAEKSGETGKDKDKDMEKEKEKEQQKDKEPEKEAEKEAKTATVKAEEIKGFARQPEAMQALLRYALELTGRGLTYKAGSADPDLGGTDCSGFVYNVLQKHGHTAVPRQSNEMYQWTWKAGTFRACNGVSLETFEFKELRPGDLLFWVNSTRDGKTSRNPPVTHVMIYLGERVADGRRICAGASDGRTYDGQRMCGVSVFDFKLPAPESVARFIGYAHLPDASKKVDLEPTAKPDEPAAEKKPAAKPSPSGGKPKAGTSPKSKPRPKTKK